MKAFHAYDVRGVYNKDFNKDDVYRIGFFLPSLLNADKVLVGRDVRESTEEIYDALCRGINDAGADVYSIGLSTTPMVYFSTAKFGFDASVMITASHNPREYNGLKISRTNALPVGFDTGLGELEQMTLHNEIIPAGKKGTIHELPVREEYIKFLKQYLPDFSDLRLAVDCSNGMAGLLIRELLGDHPDYIFEELDGTFPNHEANPLVQENVEDLKKLVLSKGADLGIIFDGDADRVMFVDEKGSFISPDLIIALMGHYFLKNEKGKVLQDIRSSKAVGEYITKMGGEMNTWRVGRAYAALKLREIGGIYGGELAGHYYFRDFYYSDSGLLACLIVLNVIAEKKKQGVLVSDIINGISSYANSGEINFRIEQKQQAMDAVKDHFEKSETVTAFYDFDGYRLEFEDWWFNVRPSNTEPYLRFLAEAKSHSLLTEKVEQVKKIINSFM